LAINIFLNIDLRSVRADLKVGPYESSRTPVRPGRPEGRPPRITPLRSVRADLKVGPYESPRTYESLRT